MVLDVAYSKSGASRRLFDDAYFYITFAGLVQERGRDTGYSSLAYR
jgi:hypothetical protein